MRKKAQGSQGPQKRRKGAQDPAGLENTQPQAKRRMPVSLHLSGIVIATHYCPKGIRFYRVTCQHRAAECQAGSTSASPLTS